MQMSSKAAIRCLDVAWRDVGYGAVISQLDSLDDASPSNVLQVNDLLFNFDFWNMLPF